MRMNVSTSLSYTARSGVKRAASTAASSAGSWYDDTLNTELLP